MERSFKKEIGKNIIGLNLVDFILLTHDMFNMTIGVISTVVDCIISTCLHQKMSVFELLGDLLANAAACLVS